MDTKSQETLESILSKEIGSLLQSDIDFLNARESYLTDAQRETFSSVLGSAPAKKSKKSE